MWLGATKTSNKAPGRKRQPRADYDKNCISAVKQKPCSEGYSGAHGAMRWRILTEAPEPDQDDHGESADPLLLAILADKGDCALNGSSSTGASHNSRYMAMRSEQAKARV